mmetsp:Transcript_57688/g.65835  ORF Transcript_57688/g.65835 Transcript_57688/m.65835 type:complete len:346 (+) Transcript_57688:148-1185(+)
MESAIYKIKDIPTWAYDFALGEWCDVSSSSTAHTGSKPLGQDLKIATFNVLLDQYDDKVYHPHFLYPEDRYQAVADELAKMDLDVICLNECTKTCLAIMEKQDWIQKSYYLSESTKNGCESLGYRNFGNCIFSRVQPHSFQTLTLAELKSRPVILADFSVKTSRNSNESFVVAATHLTARTGNHPRRARELTRLYEALDKNFSSHDHYLILGDLNFHAEHERSSIRFDYQDIWTALYDLEEHPGYTWNAQENLMSRQIWPVFENRKMRLDRILYKAKSVDHSFEPKKMEIFGNKPIYNPEDQKSRTGLFRMLGNKMGDLFTKNLRDKEEYLYCSDHYGLWVNFHA